jgi:hypothetical protein
VRPGFTPYIETKFKGRECHLTLHTSIHAVSCAEFPFVSCNGGAESMSVGEDELTTPVAAPERIIKFCGGSGRI